MQMHHTQLRPPPRTNRDLAEGQDYLGHQLVAGYSNQMQLAQGQVLVRVCALVQSATATCSYAKDALDPLQLALVVVFQSSTSAHT